MSDINMILLSLKHIYYQYRSKLDWSQQTFLYVVSCCLGLLHPHPLLSTFLKWCSYFSQNMQKCIECDRLHGNQLITLISIHSNMI
ncbi:hypothetical protein JHK85_026110 [Glycine max]|uniref:Uncharacterized protein n=2 Tax=Glycine subgen. Soja TaxID=1462606 RepID=K7LEM3_SOYBN|nr:hypothetical protein JHK85_026110 [Glycine max]KAH1043571.1 hypothetical protein GYH30_025423 [Glycine max]RZB92600.1 hypothetical protein D0Y65_024528 [Glycine soja]